MNTLYMQWCRLKIEASFYQFRVGEWKSSLANSSHLIRISRNSIGTQNVSWKTNAHNWTHHKSKSVENQYLFSFEFLLKKWTFFVTADKKWILHRNVKRRRTVYCVEEPVQKTESVPKRFIRWQLLPPNQTINVNVIPTVGQKETKNDT